MYIEGFTSGLSVPSVSFSMLVIMLFWLPWLCNPWRRKWQPTPVFLPGKPLGWRSLAGYSPWGHKVGHDWVTSLHLWNNCEIRKCDASSLFFFLRIVWLFRVFCYFLWILELFFLFLWKMWHCFLESWLICLWSPRGLLNIVLSHIIDLCFLVFSCLSKCCKAWCVTSKTLLAVFSYREKLWCI